MKILILLSLLLFPQDAKKRGWADLGVRLEDGDRGARVVQTYKDALLKKDDVITRFDGARVRSAEQVMAALYDRPLKKEVDLVVLRDGETERMTLEPLTIRGQARAGLNNTVHHPSARRAIALERPEVGDGYRTVYVFDFDISLAWNATKKELDQIEDLVEKAGALFFDMTDGQMRWRTVTVYNNRENWDTAYYLIQKRGSSGVEHVTPGGRCRLNFGMGLNSRNAVIIFAHEAGHMSLGAGDEYAYGRATREECVCIMSGHCFRGVRDLCVADTHDYTQKTSCWENLRRFYPNLKAVTKPVKGPEPETNPTVVFLECKNAALKRKILEGIRKRLVERRRVILRTIEEELERALEP